METNTYLFYVGGANKKWEEYWTTQPFIEDTSNNVSISKRDFWVAQNLNNKGYVYEFGFEGVIMKQQSRRS